MVFCQGQAIGCYNDSSRTKGKSFYSIPDPVKELERCAKWIAALKSAKFNLNNYQYNRNHVVCSDHFEPRCFEHDLKAELCGTRPRKILKDDAIPTIFIHRGPVKMRTLSERRISGRRTKQVSYINYLSVLKFHFTGLQESTSRCIFILCSTRGCRLLVLAGTFQY